MTGEAQTPRLSGATILVAEDEPLIAADLADMLRDEGAKVVVATNLSDSLKGAEMPELTLAIVDHRFGRSTSADVCAKLDERGIPFVVHTGFDEVPMECKHGVILRKPERAEIIVKTLVDLLQNNVSDQA